MRLKEIKPGMVVHCKTQEEANILCDTICNTIVEKSKWKGFWVNYRESTCYKISNAGFYSYGRIASYKDSNITEFSDLILPELKAEEVVPILTEICNRYNGNEYCEGCPLNGLEHICNGNECPFTFKDYKQVMEICVQWKTNHEKKEPEIEWVYRVFGAENYGEKFFQTEEEAIKRCEELAKSQKTKQYARYERVCRVKAVE